MPPGPTSPVSSTSSKRAPPHWGDPGRRATSAGCNARSTASSACSTSSTAWRARLRGHRPHGARRPRRVGRRGRPPARRSSRAENASWWRWPRASSRPPTCCSWTSPRPTWTLTPQPGRGARARLPRGGRMVSHDRYLLDETVRPSQRSTAAGADVARQLLLLPRRAGARAGAADPRGAAHQKEIARLEEAIRRYKQWASMVDDRRHTIRARNTERRIERMDTVDRPVLERRKIALELRSQARGGKRVAEWRDAGRVRGGARADRGRSDRVPGRARGSIGDNGRARACW